jgi:hypothetical protein
MNDAIKVGRAAAETLRSRLCLARNCFEAELEGVKRASAGRGYSTPADDPACAAGVEKAFGTFAQLDTLFNTFDVFVETANEIAKADGGGGEVSQARLANWAASCAAALLALDEVGAAAPGVGVELPAELLGKVREFIGQVQAEIERRLTAVSAKGVTVVRDAQKCASLRSVGDRRHKRDTLTVDPALLLDPDRARSAFAASGV